MHGVTGPDEYTMVVNDNLFTNVMARYNLDQAAKVMRQLRSDLAKAYERVVARLDLDWAEVEEWIACADAMAIPYDAVTGINPQDSHFLDREVRDLANTPADSWRLLLHYHPLVGLSVPGAQAGRRGAGAVPAGGPLQLEQKRADFEYYDPITTGDSTLSGVVQSIIAAEVGYREPALRYFRNALFVDLADLHGNTTDGVHVASTGGVWNCLVYGFGGMRDYNGVVTFDPRLPESWEGISFHLTLKGTRIRVDLTADQIMFTVLAGDRAEVSVAGTGSPCPRSRRCGSRWPTRVPGSTGRCPGSTATVGRTGP